MLIMQKPLSNSTEKINHPIITGSIIIRFALNKTIQRYRKYISNIKNK
ncbi:hypothetical protein MACH09_11280 [Vibrio sp. MACH09]|nr:hypothetical protein MACH09_11280 [Vibrio sp. MACH09]